MPSFGLAVSPLGRVRIDRGAPDAADIDAPAARRIKAAFERGWAHGVLHVGASELELSLPPGAAWFRELGKRFVSAVCASPDLEERREQATIGVGDATLDELVGAAPPFIGSELLTAELVLGIWRELEAAFRQELAEHQGSV